MNFSLDALSLPLQWLIILPLFLIIVLGIWFQQSRLIKEGFYNDKKGEAWQQRGHVGKVVSTLSLGDWSALILVSIFLVSLTLQTFLGNW